MAHRGVGSVGTEEKQGGVFGNSHVERCVWLELSRKVARHEGLNFYFINLTNCTLNTHVGLGAATLGCTGLGRTGVDRLAGPSPGGPSFPTRHRGPEAAVTARGLRGSTSGASKTRGW